MTYIVTGSEIVLSGEVGDFGDGLPFFTAADARAALAKVGTKRAATVRLNSGGGSAFEGSALASVFAAHPGGVEVIVEGVAASAASVAACGAGKVTMALGAVWMLHEASTATIGTSEDHAAAIAALDAINAGMAEIYSRKSSIPIDTIRTMMAAETWLTADETVDAGFADGVVGQDEPRKPARFAYAARYQHPPAALLDRLPKAKGPPPRPVIADDEPLAPAEIAELCAAAEQPDATADLIRARATLPQARARLDVMATIRPMLAMVTDRSAITASLRAEALSGKLSVAQVRERIFDAMAARSEDPASQVDHHKRTGNGDLDGRARGKAIMQKLVAERFGPAALNPKDKRP